MRQSSWESIIHPVSFMYESKATTALEEMEGALGICPELVVALLYHSWGVGSDKAGWVQFLLSQPSSETKTQVTDWPCSALSIIPEGRQACELGCGLPPCSLVTVALFLICVCCCRGGGHHNSAGGSSDQHYCFPFWGLLIWQHLYVLLVHGVLGPKSSVEGFSTQGQWGHPCCEAGRSP